jgi:glyoxylase-like metal-dependent hydrolase (beta-lactamase superfamily II)
VLTHIHPDHHGLSARLRDACGGWVAMHPAERDSLSAIRWLDGDARREDLAWLRGCGVPDDVAAGLAVTDEALAAVLAMAKPDILLDHGDLVPLPGRRLRAVWTPGHTPGHLCLHEESGNLLLTGDHVTACLILPEAGPGSHAGAGPTGSRIRAYGGPARAGAFSAEAHTVVRRKPRNFSAWSAVGKSRSMTT